jgi:PIN domain nuclease of toxin-antitoxin system
VIYLDTHVAVWLYNGKVERLSQRAADAVEQHELLLSPTVMLELGYMFELGRNVHPAGVVVAALRATFGVELCDQPFASVAHAALDLSWTRDPFDRLIVGQAVATKRQLVTKDGFIREHFADAIW